MTRNCLWAHTPPANVHTHTHTYTHTQTYTHTYIHTHTHIHTYIHTYTHTHKHFFGTKTEALNSQPVMGSSLSVRSYRISCPIKGHSNDHGPNRTRMGQDRHSSTGSTLNLSGARHSGSFQSSAMVQMIASGKVQTFASEI